MCHTVQYRTSTKWNIFQCLKARWALSTLFAQRTISQFLLISKPFHNIFSAAGLVLFQMLVLVITQNILPCLLLMHQLSLPIQHFMTCFCEKPSLALRKSMIESWKILAKNGISLSKPHFARMQFNAFFDDGKACVDGVVGRLRRPFEVLMLEAYNHAKAIIMCVLFYWRMVLVEKKQKWKSWRGAAPSQL